MYLWKYACEKRRTTVQFLKFLQMQGFEYIFVRDIDSAPSVEAKKEELTKNYEGLGKDRIAIVVMEIESWYLAGADERLFRKYGIASSRIEHTDTMTKEDFNRLIPRRLSRVVFMHEILRDYHAERARGTNRSFRYFTDRWLHWQS
ncbi:hypothetical protein, partial [Methanothrix sp.]|uniref:hypothetical protein n=1 Tax=Methanothrix sp. TaxID=90426 RepID=UPI0034E23871